MAKIDRTAVAVALCAWALVSSLSLVGVYLLHRFLHWLDG